MKNRKRILCIALILILIGSIGAAVLQTDFGKVTIKDVYIPTGDQQYMHALAFIPKQASEDNKLPCVITSHGWLNSAEVQDAASIELSRRGIDRDMWDEVLDAAPRDDSKIDKFISSRLSDPDDRDQVRKVSTALFRRGYSWEDIREALNRFNATIED